MTHQSPAIIHQTTPDTIPETIFPTHESEIIEWAKKYEIINSYDERTSKRIAGLSCIGKFQKTLLEKLMEGNPVSEQQKDFIEKTQQVVQLLKSSTIGEGIKKTIIETIATDYNPWMHDGIFANMVKHISCEEIIPNYFVQIRNIDYHNPAITSIGGEQRYFRPNNPDEIYNHCISLKNFSELEKKIIAFMIDKKPYRTNKILLTKKIDAIKDIIIDREKGVIQFITGSEMHDAFSRYYFLHIIFNDLSREEYGDQVYNRSVEEKKEKVINSELFKKHIPDFMK